VRNAAVAEAAVSVACNQGERIMSNEISEVTRRAVIDFITTGQLGWSGRLNDDDFLARLYDLTTLPSQDYRYRNAAGDIHQHRVNNYDWADDWVFYDSRFNILHASDEQFLRFLCESLHPVVRPSTEEARRLVDGYNKELAADGWEIVEAKQISGKPVYAPRKADSRVEVFKEPTGWQKVDRQLQEVRLRLDTADSEEQYQTVGLLCRETLISVAQEVYDPIRHVPADGTAPSDTDVKRMLDAIFDADLKGSGNEEARARTQRRQCASHWHCNISAQQTSGWQPFVPKARARL
jgi:AbiJ N-terminal domain 3